MNRYIIILKKVLPVVLAVYCLYVTFSFIFNLELLKDSFDKLGMPHFLLVAAVIVTSGVGLQLGGSLLMKPPQPERRLLLVAFWFSAYIFILQLVLTITPSVSACHCTTLSESIMNIADWSRVETAGGLWIFSMLVIKIVKKDFKTITETNSTFTE